MERALDVMVSRGDRDVMVGTLWLRVRGAKESASFQYAESWLRDPRSFALEPELPLAAGRFHTGRPVFVAFTDPMPDRWGQTLLRRHERARARAEGRAPRTLFTADFLARVDDETRLGALRFRDLGAEAFLTVGSRVPPLVQLPRLLRASQRVLADEESDDDLLLLLAPGTSLGGARPKASVRRPNDALAVAKFPAREDDWPVTRWEATTLTLAAASGIEVPAFELVVASGRPVLVLERFDRAGPRRIPYMSALTALSARDGEVRSYLEIAEALRMMGAAVARDLPALWTRMVFNILVSNTDDHLRNHAFLHEPRGWRLSPAYDLNPTPVDVRPRVHALALDEVDQAASIDTAFSVAASFALTDSGARAIARRVARAVGRWRIVAKRHGITPRQIDRMASAFDHEDLRGASR